MVSKQLTVATQGDGDTRDITPAVEQAMRDSGLREGAVILFVIGSTAGLTTIENEEGAIADLRRAFESIAPRGADYAHHERWHDDNGHSHVRAALLGPSLVVPFTTRKLVLGTWQQIVLVDFDTRPRQRRIFVQMIGE